jgi:hypothetical protein
MPAEQALRRIRRDVENNPAVNVVLGSRPNPNEQDDLRRLNISANLQAGFQEIAGNALENELRLIPYEPGYKLDSGEVCWIYLQHAAAVRNTVQRVLNFQALALYEQDNDFIDSLGYYALFARAVAQRGTVFFRKTSEKLVLGRGASFAAVFRRGHYDTMEETVFLFDRHIDCWSDGRYMFISNVGNFERMFRYVEQLQARAQQTVDALLQRVPISNADEFREACTTQIRFMTKLGVIATKPYLAQIGMVDIRRAIDEHGLPVEIVQNGGRDMLVFDPDPSRRWILLKLLDDDYLNSVMTHLKYEVNSKIARLAAAQ